MSTSVFVGADRVARNGDVCNKIGTYDKALAARDNNVPFYVALPSPTIDWKLATGAAIPIEARDSDEVLTVAGRDDYGQTVSVAIAPHGTRGGQLRVRRDAGATGQRAGHRAWRHARVIRLAGGDVPRVRRGNLTMPARTEAAGGRRTRVARGGHSDRARHERGGHQSRQVGQRQRALAGRRLRRLPDHADGRAVRQDLARANRRDDAGRRSARVTGAVIGVAFSPRHLRRARRRAGHRAHARAVRHDARVPASRHSAVPLHGGGGRRQRHPLRAVRDLRHAGTVGPRGRGAGGSPRLPAREPRNDRRRRVAANGRWRLPWKWRRWRKCTGARCRSAIRSCCRRRRWHGCWRSSPRTGNRRPRRTSLPAVASDIFTAAPFMRRPTH